MTDRELAILGLLQPPYVLLQDGAWEGLDGAGRLFFEFRRELAACLPPETERALRRTQVRPRLVEAPARLMGPERPERHPWVVYLAIGAVIALWLGWQGWFR